MTQYPKNNMKYGVDYHLYNSSYHKQKSAIYSYKANSYLNDCGHNIAQIAFNPRFVGLATCALLIMAAVSTIPVAYINIVTHCVAHTLALISQDFALIFTGAIFSSEQSYSVLDKARVFGTTLMLLDRYQHGFKIAKCFVDNTKNLVVYAGYQCLSWGEYFKSVISDFFNIQKENDEILDKIPQKKVIESKDLVEIISMHQKYVDFYSTKLRSLTKVLSKDIALEGVKLLGINSIMSSVWAIAENLLPFRNVIPSELSSIIKIAGLVGSVSPLFSSNYVKTHCNGNVFSIKSANYHLAQYASRGIYNKFIDALGTAVILSSSLSALIAYHSMALYKAKWQQAHEQSKAKSILQQDTKGQQESSDKLEVSDNDIFPEIETAQYPDIDLFAGLSEEVECGG